MRIAFGEKTSSTARPAMPAIHSDGWMAAIARPPSSGTIGSRLKRLSRKPVEAAARSRSESWSSPSPSTTAAPSVPSTGPASPIFAST